MRPRVYSLFWIAYGAGLICLSPIWRDREEPEPIEVQPAETHPAEHLAMGAWLRLSEAQRATVIQEYANRRPKLTRLTV